MLIGETSGSEELAVIEVDWGRSVDAVSKVRKKVLDLRSTSKDGACAESESFGDKASSKKYMKLAWPDKIVLFC